MASLGKLSMFFAFIVIFGSVSLISAKDVVEKPAVDADSVECVLCEFVMKELEKTIAANATEEEIIKAVEQICSFLPTTVQDDCKRLIEDYGEEIIDLLVQLEPPSKICQQIGLCPSSSDKSTIPGPQCAICRMIMGKLTDMLASNATEEEIEAALDKVCSLLPSSYAKECDTFVKDFTPTIIHLILKEVAPEAICALLQLCDAPKPPPVPVHHEADASGECTLCEFIMKEVESMLTDNSTEAEIQAALEKVCSILPSTIKDECDQFIKNFLPALFQLLVKEVPPKKVCTLLKFCTSSKPVLKKPLLLTKAKQVLSAKVDDYKNCALCEFVMKEIDSELSQNATEEEITKVVEKICTVLPGTLKAECDSFLETYGKTLITLLVQQLDPKKICTAIGLCGKDTKVFQTNPADGPVKANPEDCELCEFIMSELKDLISKNSTEAEIKQALDKVCGILPSTLKTGCLLFVNKYSDRIIELLVMEMDPKQICRAIGFCDAIAATSDDECDLCQMLVRFADDFIRANSTEQELVKGLLDVCSILPSSSLKDECTDFVNEYGAVIPDLVAELFAPLKVCQEVNMCPKAKQGMSICSQGPVVWCASLENAKLCNAVTHCQRHVWH